MDINNNPLDLPPTAEQLRQLAKNGILNRQALKRGLKIINHIPNRAAWEKFLSVLLLILGTGFAVSGIFFFFAYNWANMHRFFKLGLLEVLVLISIGLAYWLGMDRLSGKIALAAAGLIVGALLAVFGQVYQTGADSYQLFLTWGFFIVGWMLISKFTPLWLIWILLIDLSLWFYWNQMIGDINSQFFLCGFLLNGGAILIWEIAHARKVDWLKSRWTPRLLSLPTFIVLVTPTITLIFSSGGERSRDPFLFLMLILFLIFSAVVLYIYSSKILDLFMLTICIFSLILAFNSLVVNVFEDLDEFLLFCLSGLFIGQAALLVTWLRNVSKSWEAQQT